MDFKNIADYEEYLAKYDKRDKVISSEEMLEKIKNEPTNEIKFKCGIPTLDRYTEGFEGGELIIVAGATKHGKSLLCQTMTNNMSMKGVNSIWFSYEMPVKQFVKRFPKLPLFFLPQTIEGNAISWIEAKIWEAKIKYGVKAIFIDHLHFLFDMAQNTNVSLQIGALMRQLKKIAMKHNIVIFLIAHLKKVKLEESPTLDDLRDSSFIGQESDSVIMIARKCEDGEYKNEAKIYVQTHRRTGVMGKSLVVNFKDGLFYEQSNEMVEQAQLILNAKII